MYLFKNIFINARKKILKNFTKPHFFIFELTVINLPLALFLKIFGKVYIMKYSGLCSFFLKNSLLPSIQDFADQDQWNRAKENTHTLMRRNLIELSKFAPYLKTGTIPVDTLNIFLQQVAINLESTIFFHTLIKNYHTTKSFYLPTQFHIFIKQNIPLLHKEIYPEIIIPLSHIFAYLDSQFNSFHSTIKTTAKLFRPHANKRFKKYKYLCSFCTLSDISLNEKGAGFDWLTNKNITPASETLYIFQTKLPEKIKKTLENRNLHVTSITELYFQLPLIDKIKIVSKCLQMLLLNVISCSYKMELTTEFTKEFLIWDKIFKILNPTHLVYSFSNGWPEPPLVLASNFNKISSHIWFYSAGEFSYSMHQKKFNDIAIRYSVFSSSELWVWNDWVKSLLERRLLFPKDACKIQVIGPILNDDWSKLFKNREKSSNTKPVIAIYDLTPMKTRMRLNYSCGPFCNKHVHDSFYEGVRQVIQEFPQVDFLIKTKRKFNPQIYNGSYFLSKIQEDNYPNVTFLASEDSPYESISRADLVISSPFTSPTFIALAIGKPAFYFNPTSDHFYTANNYFDLISINGVNDLKKAIELLISKKLIVRSEQLEVNLIDIVTKIKNRLSAVEN